MRGFLGLALCALFYVFLHEYLSMWTANCLLRSSWFSSASCCSRGRVWSASVGRGRPGCPSALAAAMADRRATALRLPDMLRREIAPDAGGEVLNAGNAGKRFRALKAVNDIGSRSHPACAGRAEQGRQSSQPAGWHAPPDSGHAVLGGSGATGRTADQIAQMGTGPSFLITRLFPT